MKKEETNLIERQIKEKKKLSKEAKEKINQVVFQNLVIGILIVLYFIFVNLGYYNITKDIFITDIKVFSMCLIVITVILFEIAYNKKNSKLGIYGIETLLVALVTLFMQYVYFYEDRTFIKLYMLMPLGFAIYYVIKSTIITAKLETEYKTSLSDIREITKKEKKKDVEEVITEDKDDISTEEKNTKKQNSTKTTKKSTKKVTEEPKEKTTKTTKKTEKVKTNTTKKKTTKKENTNKEDGGNSTK